MLNIVGSMKTLKGELRSSTGLILDILGVLNSVKPDTNLTKEIGTFVVNFPEYKVMAKDADSAKKLLRKVCTGEISAEEAAKHFKSAFEEVSKLLNMLEEVK